MMGYPLRSLKRNGTFKKRKHPEDLLQILFANWLADCGYLHNASCSGMRTFPKVMARMRRMGAKKGFPDIQIMEPTEKHHGLYIELKSETGRPSSEQKEWREALKKKGYCSLIMPTGLVLEDGLEWCKTKVDQYLMGWDVE